ncbi:ATP-grasp domain-containing protein [Agrococcus sp. 1P02AA]|uniref:ATP-grasp domain-containing protein n=1 Tax=Agrococcus sp. 1P02AA TaxID=3132259 RepID=UPI0039A6745C
MKNILITGAGGPAGRALIAQLHGMRIDGEEVVLIGADTVAIDDPRLSLSARLPAALDPAYTPALQHLIGVVRADLIIPTVAAELPVVAALCDLLGADLGPMAGADGQWSNVAQIAPWVSPPFAVSPPGPTAVAADALHTMWALDRAGVSVPDYAPAEQLATANAALERFRGPIVVKPRVSHAGRRAQVVDSSDLLDWASLPTGTIVQSFAPGAAYRPQAFRSWETGRLEVVVLEIELRKGRIEDPSGIRRCARGEVRDVEHLAARAVEALGLLGPIDLDIRRTEDGTPVVLGVDARFGASSGEAPELVGLLIEEVFGRPRLVDAGLIERSW